jgi:hypothetical protein
MVALLMGLIKDIQVSPDKRIHLPQELSLQQGKTIIEGDEALKHTRYYKELFGPYENNTIFLDESYQADIPQVRELENKMLIQSFSEEEVQKAVFQMEHNKDPVRMDSRLSSIRHARI